MTELVLVLAVCPICLSWQSDTNCADCGSDTCPPDTCSKCGVISSNKYCASCGGQTYGHTIALIEQATKKSAQVPLSSTPAPGNPPRQTQPTPQPSYATSQSPSNPYVNSQPPSNLFPTRNPNQRTVDTTSIIGSGISPSAVAKGREGSGKDDPLAKYRVNPSNPVESEDWNKTLRSASRANIEDESGGPRYPAEYTVPTATPSYAVTQAPAVVRPSEEFRSNSATKVVYKAPVYNPPNSQTNVVATPTIRPSVLKEQGDPLEKYRVKSGDTTVVGVAAIPTIRPSILKDQSEDPLSKYRLKSPEEEEKTWEIDLRYLPTHPGKLVELFVDDRQLFSGMGNGGMVTTHVTALCNGSGSNFVLKISVLNFNLTRTLDLAKGRFVRFAVEEGQMKFRQQKAEFDI